MTTVRITALAATMATAIAVASLCKPALALDQLPHDDGSTTIVFGGVAYDLPTSDVGRVQRSASSINLLLSLPDMKSVPPETGADTAHGLGNKILLSYEYGIDFLPADEQFRHLLKNAHLSEEDSVGFIGSGKAFVGDYIISHQVLYCSLDEHRYVLQFFKDMIYKYPNCFSMERYMVKQAH